MMGKYTSLFYLRKHIFLRENVKMSLHIFRGDRLGSIQYHICEEIIPLFCQTEFLKFVRWAVLCITAGFRIDHIKHNVVRGKRSNPAQRYLFLSQFFLFFQLFHLRVNDTDAEDQTVSAMHPGDLHIDIHRGSRINQAVGSCEHSLFLNIPEDPLFREQSQEGFPILLIYAGHCVAPCRFEEILTPAYNRQLFTPGL